MKQKWVKRIARAMLPCFVFFVFSFSFAPKAHAVSWEGTMSYGIYAVSRNGNYDPRFFAGNGQLPVINGSVTASSSIIWTEAFDARFSFGQSTDFTGPVKLYASYYFVDRASSVTTANYTSRFWDLDAWKVTYTNSYGQIGNVEGGLDAFEAVASGSASAINGKTFVLEVEWRGSEGSPIKALNVVRDIGAPRGYQTPVGTTKYDYPDAQGLVRPDGSAAWTPIINFPSVRVISTTTSEEMESLDNIASEIAAQSDILLAMKGDLVAILQDIYAMTGDIHIAQNLLNTYVLEMLELLEDIDRTTTNIYLLLSTQLQALETAINNAATTIEAAIEAQTAAMIAYLNSVLNTGNEVPDDTYQQQQDASNILDQMESLEKPNVDTIVPEIGDYSDSGVSGVLSAIFSSNLIVTMMTLSASFAFGAYVLFGKRE